MFQLDTLAGVRRPGQHLEAGVDLQRVRGDGDRVLAKSPEPSGELDRDPGLADAGRAEQRDHLRARHPAQYRAAMGRTSITTIAVFPE